MIWKEAYTRVVAGLATVAADARPTFCGLSACVDATISLHAAGALTEAADPPEAASLADLLLRRAAAGIGGEIRVDWPGGPAWLDRRLAFSLELGGTGPHAARMLAVLGAPALLALKRRSPEQLSVLHPNVWLAHQGRAVPAQAIEPDQPNAPRIYIFEFTQGRRIGNITPPRSSRIIVRFDDLGLENDGEFATLSRRLAARAGAALLSGFNAIGGGDLAGALERTRDLAGTWFDAGIPIIHLELAGYDRPEYRDGVLGALDGPVTSVGLSLSEFEALVSDKHLARNELARAMCALGEHLHVRRVCVHADDWSATATLDDPDQERAALLLGNLLASTRAAHGRVIVPEALPAGAVFSEPPVRPQRLGAWHIVACATPYLARPAATVGLGDTFTAGCLLVLGQQPRRKQVGQTPSTVSTYHALLDAPGGSEEPARSHASPSGIPRTHLC